MNAAIYARVSTLHNGQSPEMQLNELKEYCVRRGWTVVSEFVDEGISGSKDSRPQLNKLMSDAHKRKFDCVVVWRFDRFARSFPDYFWRSLRSCSKILLAQAGGSGPCWRLTVFPKATLQRRSHEIPVLPT